MSNVKEEDFMLTTFDNPFNPFDDFVSWWKEDLRLSHDCCGLLAKEANTSPIYSDKVNKQIELQAIDEIVSRWPRIFRKVSSKDYQRTNKS